MREIGRKKRQEMRQKNNVNVEKEENIKIFYNIDFNLICKIILNILSDLCH